jgi:hypothetical protein
VADDARVDPPDRKRWLYVGTVLAVATLVRVSVMFYGSLFPDEATVGLMAKHVLRGENFPVFFYRQTYMGSLNGIHLVPALFLFGPSVLLVRLNAIAWSLLFPLGIYVLGRRVFDEPTGRAALLLAAVSPLLLTYWSTVAEPHFETNVFGVWLLVLALAALTAPSEATRIRALAVFGFVAGLAWWTNFKVVVILAPALALLALRGLAGRLGRGWALMAALFVLGSLPAWLFYAFNGDSAAGSTASVGKFTRLSLNASVERLRDGVPTLLGAYRWPATTALRQTVLALNITILVTALALAVREALARRWRREPPTARDWGVWLLLLVVPAALGALSLSPGLGALGHGASARYILPIYVPLLVCAGALVARAWRRSRALGGGLLVFLLAFHLWTLAEFLWPLSPALRAREATLSAARVAVAERLAARPVDALYVDDTLRALVWAFLLDRPTVSAVDTEIYVPSAGAADAAERLAILGRGGIAADLALLGATSRSTPLPGWQLYEDIRVPARGYRLVPRDGWRLPDDPARPAVVADGDLVTAWPRPGQRIGPSEGLVVDLESLRQVARVIFWPSMPTWRVFPLRLAGSEDGTRWEALGVVPAVPRQPAFTASGRPVFRPRNGWLEVAIEPRPLRYLRLEPAERVRQAPWGIAELQVYEEASEAPTGSGEPAGIEHLLARLRTHGTDRLLADPVISARVARGSEGRVATLVANGVVDNHGAAPPPWLASHVQLRARDALLVPAEEAPALRERLEGAGAEFLAESLGSHVLVRVLAPLGSTAPCRPLRRRAVTHEPGGAADRVVLEASLEGETMVSGVSLRHPRDAGRTLRVLEVTLSGPGKTWEPAARARAVPGWGWAGRTLFKSSDGVTEIVLDSSPARAVRVTVVGAGSTDLAVRCVRGIGRG